MSRVQVCGNQERIGVIGYVQGYVDGRPLDPLWISSFDSGPLAAPTPHRASATGSALIVSLHPSHPRLSVLNSRLPPLTSHLSLSFAPCQLQPVSITTPSLCITLHQPLRHRGKTCIRSISTLHTRFFRSCQQILLLHASSLLHESFPLRGQFSTLKPTCIPG